MRRVGAEVFRRREQVGVGWQRLEDRRLLVGSMYVGTNLDGIVDWGATAFVNMVAEARPWDTRNADSSGEWSTGLSDFIPLDADGWPREVPFDPGNGAPEQLVHSIVPVRGAGTYMLLTEGTGTIRFVADAGLLDPSTPYSRSVTVEMSGGTDVRSLDVYASDFGDGFGEVFVIVEASDPADPLRFQLISPGHEVSYLDDPFAPVYTDELTGFSALRYMDWGRTNNSPVVSWSERTTAESFTQAGSAGAALEFMVAMSNLQHQDAWLTIPAHADDMYVLETAAYVRDHLDPGLKVFVEYSNETWNTIFEQTTYVQDKGESLGLDADPWKAGQKFVVQRSAEIWSLFESQLGEESDAKLVKVLGSHAANRNTTLTRLNALLDDDLNPDAIMPDALAIAPYFGTTVGYDMVSEGVVNTSTADDVLDRALEDLRTNVTQRVADHHAIADDFGLWLITYEGGQHFTGSPSNTTLVDLLIAANRSPRMYDIYLEYLDRLRDGGVELHTNFSFISEPSAFGSWGIQESPAQPIEEAHKLRAIKDWIALNPPTNIPPVARAGNNISVVATDDAATTVHLDGSGSRDFEGSIVDYRWEWDGNLVGTGATLDVALPVGVSRLTLQVADDQGAVATDTLEVNVVPKAATKVLVESDFQGGAPGLAAPWTNTSYLAPHVDFLGWELGDGFTGSGFDDVFSFYGIFDSVETDLAYALANDLYLSTTVSPHPGYELDLRGARWEFGIDRIDGHSPRRYVVKSSQDGFNETLFDSGRITTLDPVQLAFQLPFDLVSDNPVEFRVYAFEARYAKHDAGLVGFRVNGATTGPVDLTLTSEAVVDEGASLTLDWLTSSTNGDITAATWMVDWGDGTAAEEFSSDGSQQHVYADDGEYVIQVDVYDTEGVWQTFNMQRVTVVNVAPSLDLSGVDFIDEGEAYSLLLGETQDPGDDLITEWRVDWGDGTAVASYGESGAVTHMYPIEGTYTISVALVDEDGVHEAAGTKEVSVVRRVPEILSLSSEGEAEEGSPVVFQATVHAEQGSGTLLYHWDFGDGVELTGEGLNSASHVYVDDGSYAVSLRVTDERGSVSDVSVVPIEIANVSPTVQLSGPALGDVGASYGLLIEQVLDPGDDQITEYRIDWGDGTLISMATLSGPIEHVFSEAGSYTIRVDVVDEDGLHLAAGSKTLAVESEIMVETLVRSDFSTSGASLNLPYAEAEVLHPNVAWSGWSLGGGLSGSNHDGFSFFGDYPPAESNLAHAIENDFYLSATLAPQPGYELNVADTAFHFEIARLQGHAARSYSVLSSVDGWNESELLFDTGRITSLDPVAFTFSLPNDLRFQTRDAIEFRLYAYGARYYGHDSSLTAFSLDGTVQANPEGVPPAFTSPASFELLEGVTDIGSITATGPTSSGAITYAITGDGTDDALVDLDGTQLRFLSPPDFESPTDGGADPEDNVYEVQVQATNEVGLATLQDILIHIAPVNEHAPILASTPLTIVENETWVGDLTATDLDLPIPNITYSLTGSGADDGKFVIAGNSLSFLDPQDYESPTDAGGDPLDNVYEIEVRVDDGQGLQSIASRSVSVLDDREGPSPVTLVRSDLNASSIAGSPPYQATEVIAENVIYSGWSVGDGLVIRSPEEVDEETAGLQFVGDYPATLSSLDEAVEQQQFLSVTIAAESGYELDLRDGTISFSVDRLRFHAPREYVVMSSVDGFSTSSVLYTSGMTSDLGRREFSFQLPDATRFASLESIEIRIYAAAGRYFGHESSLTEFELQGLVENAS